MDKHYGHMIRILHWCTDQTMTQALGEMELTAAQGHIMGYLARQPQPPCPKDIEEVFHLSHPTVSGLLSRLEKKEFIELRSDPNDRRCKRICILPKGQQCNRRMHETITQNEERLVQGFSESEKELFNSLLKRAIMNMGGVCKKEEMKAK